MMSAASLSKIPLMVKVLVWMTRPNFTPGLHPSAPYMYRSYERDHVNHMKNHTRMERIGILRNTSETSYNFFENPWESSVSLYPSINPKNSLKSSKTNLGNPPPFVVARDN